MNHHLLRVHNPEGAARVIAEIVAGEALPLPPLSNCWVVLTSRGDGIELYPDVLKRRNARFDSQFDDDEAQSDAVSSSPLNPRRIETLARKAGWPARQVRKSSGAYVEVAVEGRLRLAVFCTGEGLDESPAPTWPAAQLRPH